MAETSRPESKRSWDFDDVVVNAITYCVVLAILTAGTGVGWCLGILGRKTLEFLNVPGAVSCGDILGNALGFGCTAYLCFRRPTASQGKAQEQEEKARLYGKVRCLAATAGLGINELLQMKNLDPNIRDFLLGDLRALNAAKPECETAKDRPTEKCDWEHL